MNVSYPLIKLTIDSLAIEKLGHELIKACAFLLIPTELLYFSIYFHVKACYRTYRFLTLLSIVTFWLAPYLAPISCGPARCLQNFAIAIGTMKLLDIFARGHDPATYTAGKRPPDWLLALIVLTELRYESFTPNNIRIPRDQENFGEPMQLGLHVAAFAVLQSLPQDIPTVLAFEVLLAIYIIWTSMQLLLRYETSPALFGPLYLADSLSGFWSETWHNAFASPCTSLAYRPLRYYLLRLNAPVVIARSVGVLGAFSLMALFHVYALLPILSKQELLRIAAFFFLNGIATICEAAIWGRKKHWLKVTLAWVFETTLASWTASGMNIPKGISKIPWTDICYT